MPPLEGEGEGIWLSNFFILLSYTVFSYHLKVLKLFGGVAPFPKGLPAVFIC